MRTLCLHTFLPPVLFLPTPGRGPARRPARTRTSRAARPRTRSGSARRCPAQRVRAASPRRRCSPRPRRPPGTATAPRRTRAASGPGSAPRWGRGSAPPARPGSVTGRRCAAECFFSSSFSLPNSFIEPPCLPIITFAKVALAMPSPLLKSISASCNILYILLPGSFLEL